MTPIPRTVGQWAYALFFCVALPGALALWAHFLEPQVHLPSYQWPLLGALLVALGVGLWAWSVWTFSAHGRGLPMIAFPPPRPVDRGPYALINHPIYVAFVMACAGVALLTGSVAGLWVVTPLAALGCAALVLGFENTEFARRFPEFVRRPLIRLPAGEGDAPWNERLSIYPLVFVPWLICYESIGHIPVPGGVDSRMPFEPTWPVFLWAEPIYASPYLIVSLVPMLIRSRRILREFALRGLISTLVVHLAYLSIPLLSPPRPFAAIGFLGGWLDFERADHMDGRVAFPAFHVIWTFIGVLAFRRAFPRLTVWLWIWGVVVAASCIATGMHSLADVVAACLVTPLLCRWPLFLGSFRRWSQHAANSWREWRIGPVRIINYAAYAFVAAFIGVFIIGACAGEDLLVPVCVVALAALVGAALWGQYWVGGPTLLRPFGYFGSVIGAIVGVGLVAAVRGLDADAVWRLIAATALAAPLVQAIGRIRCLVNGCCHGRETASSLAIVCTNASSRVVRLSGLAGRAIHPTQLYSILANIAIGLVLLRLWREDAPPSIIAGAYLIGQGMARFVEEHYRGEPHTPSRAGLRLYQWCAIASVVAGIVVPAWPCTVAMPAPAVGMPLLLDAAAIGAIYALAMGVDFPASARRFSRLA